MEIDAWQCQQCDHVALREDFEPVDPSEILAEGDDMSHEEYEEFESDPPYRCPSCGGFNFGFHA